MINRKLPALLLTGLLVALFAAPVEARLPSKKFRKLRKEIILRVKNIESMCKNITDIDTRKLATTNVEGRKKLGEQLAEAWKARYVALEDISEFVEEISEDDSKRVARFLILDIALQTSNFRVYAETLKALASIADEVALEFIAENARHKDWRLRVMLAELFGIMNETVLNKALVGLLKDTDPRVVGEAVRSVKKRSLFLAVGPLIDLLAKIERRRGRTWVDVRLALVSITAGEDYPNAAAWRQFWNGVGKDMVKKNWKDLRDGKLKKPTKLKPGQFKTTGIKVDDPTFFGSAIHSKAIIFLLDVSGSMTQKDPKSGNPLPMPSDGSDPYKKLPIDRMRIERLKSQLAKCLRQLDSDVWFNIITFSDNIRPWQKSLAPATEGNKSSALKFARAFKATGATWTDAALKEAFKDKTVDTIYLLSDGAPNKGSSSNYISGVFLQDIRDWTMAANRFRKITITTLGFEIIAKGPGGDIALNFLKALANENWGEFRNIK